jgi:bis(5'-nucleosyl)-tetraphosphatase (symmetrical)
MANYFIGDIQGCFDELEQLLSRVNYNRATDILWFCGDLIARGSQSLTTLRFIMAQGDRARVVLGNHDLHLLAIASGIKPANPNDKLDALLKAPDLDAIVTWLRQQPLCQIAPEFNVIMTHAGVPPTWDLNTLTTMNQAVQAQLQSDHYATFLSSMYGNQPDHWTPDLTETQQWRYTINALTRMRFVHPDGRLNMTEKRAPTDPIEPDLRPWFAVEHTLLRTYKLVFGHWASLMGQTQHPSALALDTGCVWGEYLTLWHAEADKLITQPALSQASSRYQPGAVDPHQGAQKP